MIVLKGGYGSGKTLAVHLSIHKIHASIMNGDFGRFKYSENPIILAGYINPIYKDKTFNGIRLIC